MLSLTIQLLGMALFIAGLAIGSYVAFRFWYERNLFSPHAIRLRTLFPRWLPRIGLERIPVGHQVVFMGNAWSVMAQAKMWERHQAVNEVRTMGASRAPWYTSGRGFPATLLKPIDAPTDTNTGWTGEWMAMRIPRGEAQELWWFVFHRLDCAPLGQSILDPATRFASSDQRATVTFRLDPSEIADIEWEMGDVGKERFENPGQTGWVTGVALTRHVLASANSGGDEAREWLLWVDVETVEAGEAFDTVWVGFKVDPDQFIVL